ncbi:pyridoxamine 5'-phosphate oxidase family protein [Actinophytocola algeriensis]|uniref:Nitroimidazol reductase NimA-like FMN-containing flavoprotein (Pyridoxamine 5'-phosphate oxidase superfamily) n=1 Tax=Actinophytocola algeriensis TaxID=1768010 RepID=A0A7W7QBG7_9PSEU|nr:pyridoxamine 5'-phosphate oxidase family protein [Actinophytocola algeriensis]MBB4910562.1 nitroimidazol reductase NimA-like FMN-containing flavoprotein (pyridoxamine 5'-phosphate oxidase superfamily) [Actinophytocola algeriensis]MBE1480449.1 nitroimidazol reductase NimA-like FMN-containing flavoprotein (pyridoxamine 5'-phosphate oxidase superfamily) [Actinophytocola algeriensis]
MDSRRMQLDQQQCWERLRTAAIGRLSYTEHALPVIRAVPFVIDATRVIVALQHSASRPAAFSRVAIVAFEAGEWSPDTQTGWSVHFTGKAQVLPTDEVVQVRDLGLHAWIDGEPALYVRLETASLAGTCLTSATFHPPQQRTGVPTFPGQVVDSSLDT